MTDLKSSLVKDYRIPVTVLTGFLGSGKTTLLNRLIKDNPGKKFAIIENEFGEVPIDNELVVGVEDGVFEMSNGCICCSLNEDLINVLLKLINRPQKIDHLIVETTGIADPSPIAMNFLSDTNIKSLFRLDAIIALTDAQFIEQQLENQREACMQVAMADLLLINKTDKVEPYFKETIHNILRRMNSQAQIKESIFGEVPGVDLLAIRAFNRENIFQDKLINDGEGKSPNDYSFNHSKPVSGNDDSSKGSLFFHHTRKPHSDISSHSFVFPEPLDILRFDIWLRMILNDKTMELFRVKGILNFRALQEKLILQAVNSQYMTEGGGVWKADEKRLTKLVFIGKNLRKEILITGLKVCCSDKPFVPEEFYKAIDLK